MTYFAPTITSTGLSIPTYQDIVDQMVANAQSIYGSDIYLGIDSMDYQWISSVASIINDSFLTAQAVYNARGPATAIGSALDIIVGVNGLQRIPAVYSTASVVLSGTAGTPIVGGVVSDVNGNDWTLPTPLTIPSGGSLTVTATCQTNGAISAPAGTITGIVTPVSGWASVTNPSAATVGSPVETDSALRARQATSTAQPSQSLIEGIEGAIAAVPGVTSFVVLENDTGSTSSQGLPPYSITCVVQGGSSTAIAQAIYLHKTPGVPTNGTTSVQITDSYGMVNTINFDVPQILGVDVTVTLTELTGYTAATTSAIQAAIASYLSSLAIGGPIYNSGLYGASLSANANPSNPTFAITSVTAALHLGATLQAALASGTAYTSLATSALALPIASGQQIVIGSGTTTQTVTASAAAAVGATTVSVTSFTANAAYAVGTTLALAQSTATISPAYNQLAQGNANYVQVVT
jgi:uncharacterized phage protein gp47/JayE